MQEVHMPWFGQLRIYVQWIYVQYCTFQGVQSTWTVKKHTHVFSGRIVKVWGCHLMTVSRVFAKVAKGSLERL